MELTLLTECTHCGARYNVSLRHEGKTARCKKCSNTFLIKRKNADTVTSAIGESTGKRMPGQWAVGSVIMDLYEITGILGEGGMGTVYKVHHLGWNVDLAVKSPKLTELEKAGGASNFQLEAETWVNLGLHPNIVSCYYVRELDNVPRVFAEYIEGGSLNDWIAEGRLTGLDVMIDIAIQFAWGLQYAHDKGLVHQDVKPANLMMTLEGIAKVTDFGLAKAMVKGYSLEDGIDANFTLSSIVSTGGMTPAYCSPEQANGDRMTIKTDIWSWAVSILTMFVGEVTWPSGTIAGEVLEWYLKEGKLKEHIPLMPPQIAKLLRRCFQEDQIARPESMAEIANTLKYIYKEITGTDYPRTTPIISRATADSLNNRAVSLLDLGREAEAERLWREAVKLEPHHPESTYNLGLFLWRTAKLSDDQLIKEMEEVQRSHRDDWRGSYLLAQAHLERDDCNSAIRVLSNIEESYLQRDEVRAVSVEAQTRMYKSKRLLNTLTEHDGPVSSVCLSMDGRYGLSGSHDSTIKLWDTETGLCLLTFYGHTGAVTSVYLTPDTRFAISGGADKTVRLWDVSTGYCLHTLKGHNSRVLSVHIDNDAKNPLSGSEDDTVKLWDLATGHYLRSFVGHKGGVYSVHSGINERHVFSSGKDSTIKLWEVNTLKCIHTFRGHTGTVNSISFSQDGESMLSGSTDRTLRFWDIPSKRCLNTFTGHVDVVMSVVLSWGGRIAISGSIDKTIKQWDVSTGRCLRTFEAHSEGVSSVYMSMDGKIAISGSYDGTVNIWQVDSGEQPYHAPMILSQVLRSETALSAMMAYTKELTSAKDALSAGDFVNTAVHVRKARQQKGYSRAAEAMEIWKGLYTSLPRIGLNGAWEGLTLREHEGAVNSISIDAKNKYVLSAGSDKTLKLWDIEKGFCLRTFKGHALAVTSATISLDGEVAISGSLDSTVRLWDTSRGREIRVFRGHKGPVRGVCISYDRRLIISSSDDKTVKLWDLDTGKCLRTLEGHSEAVLSVSLSMDGRFAVSGSSDNLVKQWEMTTVDFLGLLNTCDGHDSSVTSVSLSPDGRLAVSGSDDKMLRVWDIATGRSIHILDGHTAPVTSVYMSFDSSYVLSGSQDNTIRLWDVRSGQCIRVFKGHMHGIQSVCMSMDGQVALSASEDGSIKLWMLDWELNTKPYYEWMPAANVYIEMFLTNHTPYLPGSLARRGKPAWDAKDFEKLLFILGCAGYGHLTPESVENEINRLAKQRTKKA
ncbi:MAG: protein kinase [Nitrospirae bacterium]|nr:protein kinase [Nitrospirota bacterium]